MKLVKIAAAGAALSLGLSVSAFAAQTLNFDPTGDIPSGLSAMSNSPGSAVPTSAQLSNQYESAGVLFSSTDSFIAIVGVGGSLASSPNGIGGVTSGGLLSYADPVNIDFVVPGTTNPGVTSNISITADADGINTQFATLIAFDTLGNVLDSQTLQDVGGETWTIDMPGIHSATFEFPTTNTGVPTTGSPFGGGTGIALDNLAFGDITAAGQSTSAVPLPPAAWSVLGLFGAIGILRLARRLFAKA